MIPDARLSIDRTDDGSRAIVVEVHLAKSTASLLLPNEQVLPDAEQRHVLRSVCCRCPVVSETSHPNRMVLNTKNSFDARRWQSTYA